MYEVTKQSYKDYWDGVALRLKKNPRVRELLIFTHNPKETLRRLRIITHYTLNHRNITYGYGERFYVIMSEH